MKILEAAEGGIRSSTKTRLRLGISQKRYYSRLRKLLEEGLIEKVGSSYRATLLGNLCLEITGGLMKVLSQRDRLELIDKVRRSKEISIDEAEEISRSLLNVNVQGLVTPVKMVDTWEGVVKETNAYLERAEETIHFATKYFDHRTIEAIIRAMHRGVEFKTLIDKSLSVGIKSKLKMLSMMLSHPRVIRQFYEAASLAKGFSRYVDLPYTFFVVDAEYAMVEIANPLKNSFYVAFFFHNEKVAKRLLHNFRMLWEP